MDNGVTTGIDIIEIDRIKNAIDNWRQGFLSRVFTQPELNLCGNNAASIAARFAAKEAVIKALSYRTLLCNWHDIEILSQENGRPLLKLHGKALAESSKLGFKNMDVSISHCRKYAIAVVVGQC